MIVRLLIFISTAILSSSCAARLLDLPSGPGRPAADGASVLADATSACRTVDTFIAQGSVSGRVDAQRVRGTLHIGVAAPASARLEAVAPFGQPIFLFVAQADDSTLLLTRPDRVLAHEDPQAVLEAITGIPLDPSALRPTLTGCAAGSVVASDARELGDDWRLIEHGGESIYLQRSGANGPWRIVAVVRRGPNRPEWRTEYRDFAGRFPRTVRFVSRDRDRLDVTLGLSQVEMNTPLGAEAFVLKVPAGARPITLDDLRDGGLLAGAEDQ